jgi:hypothetical protein
MWVSQKDEDKMSMRLPCGCLVIEVLESGIWEQVLEHMGYEIKRYGGRVVVKGYLSEDVARPSA